MRRNKIPAASCGAAGILGELNRRYRAEEPFRVHVDSLLELALMLCASAGNAAGKDLSALAADVLAEAACFLVIDIIDLILAECANFSSSAVGVLRTGSANGALLFDLFIHNINHTFHNCPHCGRGVNPEFGAEVCSVITPTSYNDPIRRADRRRP